MRLLVKVWPNGHSDLNAVHIPNTQNQPLCKLKINPRLWEIQDLDEKQYRVMCYHCRRIQTMQTV